MWSLSQYGKLLRGLTGRLWDVFSTTSFWTWGHPSRVWPWSRAVATTELVVRFIDVPGPPRTRPASRERTERPGQYKPRRARPDLQWPSERVCSACSGGGLESCAHPPPFPSCLPKSLSLSHHADSPLVCQIVCITSFNVDTTLLEVVQLPNHYGFRVFVFLSLLSHSLNLIPRPHRLSCSTILDLISALQEPCLVLGSYSTSFSCLDLVFLWVTRFGLTHWPARPGAAEAVFCIHVSFFSSIAATTDLFPMQLVIWQGDHLRMRMYGCISPQ